MGESLIGASAVVAVAVGFVAFAAVIAALGAGLEWLVARRVKQIRGRDRC